MFYGRCYWNLSVVKKAMSQVVGYKEREFDNEYGITPTYEGDGQTTGITPISIIAIIRMAIAQSKIVKTREKNKEFLKQDLFVKIIRILLELVEIPIFRIFLMRICLWIFPTIKG